ncbi:hypothetical protein MMPV_010046 [Pyropia vietnamensis]
MAGWWPFAAALRHVGTTAGAAAGPPRTPQRGGPDASAAVTRVPSVARTALAGADLLLLRKPGGLAADGLPKLRPIGMPEALRKLAASALARTVRDAAAALLGPHQQGVGVRSAPHVPVSAPVSAVQRPAPRRLSLRAERGAQQGDPLGPLLHALALQLPLLRLARGCPRLLIRAFHDDVVAVGPPADLARFVGAAGVAGSAIDAALAPAKCVGWSPTPQAAPEGWPAQWRADGLVQFSVPLGGTTFCRRAWTPSRRTTPALSLPL